MTTAAAPSLDARFVTAFRAGTLAQAQAEATLPRGRGADGNEVPPEPPTVTVRWISAAGEVEVKGWSELADKLKAPALKKGTAAYEKIQVLNFLGGEGWELMEQSGPATTAARASGLGSSGTWMFKRRLPLGPA